MILFIIGNGFDLSLGMKTSFTYMKKAFIKEYSPISDPLELKFYNSFKQDSELWSDFEMGIAKYAGQLKTEQEMQKFYEFTEKFTSFLSKKLIQENEKYSYKDFSDQTDLIWRSFRNLLLNYGANETVNFVTFNYTNKVKYFAQTLDGVRDFTISQEVINVHGNLESGIIVGIDNIQQIDSINTFDDNYKDKLKLLFTKPTVAKNDIKMSYQSALELISYASRIVIIGCSLGPSDETWINAISKRFRLLHNRDSIIFYNHVENKSSTPSRRENILIEQEVKNNLLAKFGLEPNEENREKIRVINEDNIFDSSKIKNKTPAVKVIGVPM